MTPLRWSPEHRLAWAIVSVLGAVIGLFVAMMLAESQIPGASAGVMGVYIIEWLAHPALYWPFPLFGFLIAALAFYAAKLLASG